MPRFQRSRRRSYGSRRASLPRANKKQWYCTVKVGSGAEETETDHNYYIRPNDIETANNSSIVLPTVAALITDGLRFTGPGSPTFETACHYTQLRRQERIFFKGSRLVTSLHFRANFDVLFLCLTTPFRMQAEWVPHDMTGMGSLVDCLSANFSVNNIQDWRDKRLQIWKDEDMHLPMLKRGFQPAADILFKKSYRLRVDEAKNMKEIDVKLYAPVGRSFRFIEAFEDSGDQNNQSQGGNFPYWLVIWEARTHDFDIGEGNVEPTPGSFVDLPVERIARQDMTAMIIEQFHVKNFFSESLLPLPITDASKTRKMIEEGA